MGKALKGCRDRVFLVTDVCTHGQRQGLRAALGEGIAAPEGTFFECRSFAGAMVSVYIAISAK